MKKLHYYSFAFRYVDGKSEVWASVYIGYNKKNVNIQQIMDAKANAGVHKDAVMISCCYLGKMKPKKMNNNAISSIS